MNRKLDPQMMPVSTNWTAIQPCDGMPVRTGGAIARSGGGGRRWGGHPATLAPARDAEASGRMRRPKSAEFRPSGDGHRGVRRRFGAPPPGW